MAFSLWHIIEASILTLNALAILNEPRFLKPRGWHKPNFADEYQQNNTIKNQLVLILFTARKYFRLPLMCANVFVIFIDILSG
mmetsp:Transcript_12865/g.14135  ORF Transcript_12865/g.14135 Transcript_12865/m.14135 type:complete len:83 (-) Transcript_12865:160-408(-)